MTLQRYKSNGHYSDGPCDNGEWVKASEAEAVIDVILRNNRVLLDQRHELMQENAKQGAEIARLRKALEEIVALNSIDYACDDIAREALQKIEVK